MFAITTLYGHRRVSGYVGDRCCSDSRLNARSISSCCWCNMLICCCCWRHRWICSVPSSLLDSGCWFVSLVTVPPLSEERLGPFARILRKILKIRNTASILMIVDNENPPANVQNFWLISCCCREICSSFSRFVKVWLLIIVNFVIIRHGFRQGEVR